QLIPPKVSRMSSGTAMERRERRKMDALARPEASTGLHRVYCQSQEVVSLLARDSSPLDILLLPGSFPSEETNLCVIIGENPAIFSEALQEAIANNQARLLYVLREGSSLPREAGGIPVFSFLVSPLQRVVVESNVRSAFDNLELARGQAALQ